MPHHQLKRLTCLLLGIGFLLSVCSSETEQNLAVGDIDSGQVSGFQRAILEDGIVTASEYEMAMIATRDRFELLGMTVGPITRSGDILEFESEADYSESLDPEGEEERIVAGINDCRDEHIRTVGLIWSESLIVTDEKEREQLLVQVRECINATGLVDVADDAEYKAIREKYAELHNASDDPTALEPVQQRIEQMDEQLKPSLLTFEDTTG